MENLNAENVKKWLEICAEDTPYPDQSQALLDALALINSQEQDKEKLGLLIDEIVKEKRELFEENKRLTAENEKLDRLANLRQRDLDNANDLLFKVEDEIERLKAQKYYMHSDGRIEMIPTVESVRADTVREMQQRLDKRFCHDPAFLGVEQRLIMDVIDQIAKEMLEGDNEN